MGVGRAVGAGVGIATAGGLLVYEQNGHTWHETARGLTEHNVTSVIAREGVRQAIDDGTAPTPDLYWDASLTSEWPPEDWELPRVTITGWVTER